LFELLKQQQPQYVPNLEVLGYLIFEKIDVIDSNKSKEVKKISSNRLLGRKQPSLRRFDWPSANRDFLSTTRGQAPKISFFK